MSFLTFLKHIHHLSTWVDLILWFQPKYSNQLKSAQKIEDDGDLLKAKQIYSELRKKRFLHSNIRNDAGVMLIWVSLKLEEYDEAEGLLDDLAFYIFLNWGIYLEAEIRAKIAEGRKSVEEAIERYSKLYSDAVCFMGPEKTYQFGYQLLTLKSDLLNSAKNEEDSELVLTDFLSTVQELRDDLKNTKVLFYRDMCILNIEMYGFWICKRWDGILNLESKFLEIKDRYEADYEPLVKSYFMIIRAHEETKIQEEPDDNEKEENSDMLDKDSNTNALKEESEES